MINQQLSRFATHENSAYPQLWRGCVGAWCPSLGPSGSRLHDYSRRNNWGTLTNMDPATDWIVSGGAYALDCDGTNDYIDCGTDATWRASAISVSCGLWVNTTSSTFASAIRAVMDTASLDTTNGGFWFLLDNRGGTRATNGISVQVRTTGGLNGIDASADNIFTATAEWRHVGFGYQNGSFAIYHNGRNVTSRIGAVVNETGNYVPRNASLALAGGNAGTNTLAGQIDDVRTYSRALAPEEWRLLARRRGIAFTPRTRRLGVPEQAAGGATPWLYARRRSQIIGAGGVH